MIARIDNDGTLWYEKPGSIQLFFALQRQAAAESTLMAHPVYKPSKCELKEGMSS